MKKFGTVAIFLISFLLLLTSYGIAGEPIAEKAQTTQNVEGWEYRFSTLLRTDGAASLFGGVHYDWFTLTGSVYTNSLLDHGLMGWMAHTSAIYEFENSVFYGGLRGTLSRLGSDDLMWDIGGRVGLSNVFPKGALAIAYGWVDVSLYEDMNVHAFWCGGLIAGVKDFQIGLEIAVELYQAYAMDFWIGLREWTEDNKEGLWSIRAGVIKDGLPIWLGYGAQGQIGWSGYILLTIRGL